MGGFLFVDYQKCVGCKTCEMICSQTNEKLYEPFLARIKVVWNEKEGWFFPLTCAMCEKAVCVSVCPTMALHRDQDGGVVLLEEKKCIGCLQCVQACPFAHMNFNRRKGVAFKCEHCGGDPQCVRFCWTEALRYLPLETFLSYRRRETAEKMMQEP